MISLMDTLELLQNLNKGLAIDLPEKLSYEELQIRLSEYFNHLIKNDFEKLIACLYRVDVSEQKLKLLLQQFPHEDAGRIIAGLIIEREQQKIKTRKQFSKSKNDDESEEKW